MSYSPPAEAHFFGGTTMDIDKYQVTFVPFPNPVIQGDNSTTLNFSILENNSNINNIYSALKIAKKDSGEVIAQYPYKFYEFSDITIPYTFHDTGTFVITLQTRIIGDTKFQAAPMEANFDLTAISPIQAMLSGTTALVVLVIISIISVGGAISIYIWKRT